MIQCANGEIMFLRVFLYQNSKVLSMKKACDTINKAHCERIREFSFFVDPGDVGLYFN